MSPSKPITMDKIVSLAKRRGFVFAGSEIYGGLANSWDYGPLGVELRNNIKKVWWEAMVRKHVNIVGLDSSILMHPKVWEASGHVQVFHDPLQECAKCHKRFRADEIAKGSDKIVKKCPECGGKLSDPREFNLMLKTHLGPLEDQANLVYLRPETAQGSYVDAELVWTAMRLKPPFGIAQIGKSFRNEITPQNFIYRMREFEQMEMQYFIRPPKIADKEDTADKIFKGWLDERLAWYLDLGLNKANLKTKEHAPKERAHYAKLAVDFIYNFPFGWSELEGVHYRTDFDLSQHMKKSGKDLRFNDTEAKQKFIPHVVETALGVDRAALTFLIDAYHEEKDKEGTRVVLRLDPRLAPVKVAVLPLLRKPELKTLADKFYQSLGPFVATQYDETGSIGRRYRRQDEIGTPYCVTVDFDSLKDQSVTLRERDSMQQKRLKLEELKDFLREKLKLL